MSDGMWRGDLTRHEEAEYLRTRRLTGADSIQRTLTELDRSATDPDHPEELRDLFATAGTIIRQLRHEVELQHALWRAEEERRSQHAGRDAGPHTSEEPDA